MSNTHFHTKQNSFCRLRKYTVLLKVLMYGHIHITKRRSLSSRPLSPIRAAIVIVMSFRLFINQALQLSDQIAEPIGMTPLVRYRPTYFLAGLAAVLPS